MYSLKKVMKFFIEVFPMIFQSSMGIGKSRCDVPNGTTQRWACPWVYQGSTFSKVKNYGMIASYFIIQDDNVK
jgi:hypothetical protein